MSNLSTLPKGDSAWLFRKAIEQIIQQVSVLETNIGSSTTGNSANTQVIFNDNGTLRGDPDLIFNTALNKLVVTSLESTTSLAVGGDAIVTGALTVATNALFVNSANGNVGLGTVAPSGVIGRILEINGGAGQARLVLKNTATGSGSGDGIQIALAGSQLQISNREVGEIVFDTDLLERFRISASGIATWSNVGGIAGTAMTLDSTGLGIGVAPSAWHPDYKVLQVKGSSFSNNGGSSDFWLSANVFLNSSLQNTYIATNAASRYRQSAGVHVWDIAPSGTAGNPITFTQAMTLDASGNLLVGVASANASGGCLQLKSGVTFPVTQIPSSNAKTLDDYEEGTWTPTLTFATPGTLAVGYSTRVGNYTKVGNLVTVRYAITISPSAFVKGTASGGLQITGLPFAASGTGTQYVDLATNLTDQNSGSLAISYASAFTILFEQTQISGIRVIRSNSAIDAANFATTNTGYMSIQVVMTYTV